MPYAYETQQPDRVIATLKMYSRVGSFPLDSSSVFETYLDLLEYVNAPGTYAYPGQIVAVANGSISSTNGAKDFSFYGIKSDLSVQVLGDNMVFDTIELATAYVTAASAKPGKILTIKSSTTLGSFELYLVNDDRTLSRVSFHASDIPDMEWANIKNKPTSTAAAIDAAVTAATHANRATLDKLSADADFLTYDGKQVAKKSDISDVFTTTAQAIPVKNQVFFEITG